MIFKNKNKNLVSEIQNFVLKLPNHLRQNCENFKYVALLPSGQTLCKNIDGSKYTLIDLDLETASLNFIEQSINDNFDACKELSSYTGTYLICNKYINFKNCKRVKETDFYSVDLYKIINGAFVKIENSELCLIFARFDKNGDFILKC
jgi:hypothetical protein